MHPAPARLRSAAKSQGNRGDMLSQGVGVELSGYPNLISKKR